MRLHHGLRQGTRQGPADLRTGEHPLVSESCTPALGLRRTSAKTRQRWEHEFDLERLGGAYFLTFRREVLGPHVVDCWHRTTFRRFAAKGLTATRPAFMKTIEYDRRRCRPATGLVRRVGEEAVEHCTNRWTATASIGRSAPWPSHGSPG